MDIQTTILLASASALWFAATALAAVRLIPAWDVAADRQLSVRTSRYEALSMDTGVLRLFLRIWGFGLVFVPLFFLIGLKMFPIACLAAVILYFLPRYALDYLIKKRSDLLRDQMADAAHSLATAVKAGLTLPQGLEEVCEETPEPLASQLRRVVFDYRRGRPLRESLELVRGRLCLEEFTLFVLALEVAMDRGGRVNEALIRISKSLKEKQRLERNLTAATAAGKQVVVILSIVPPVLVGMFWMIDPHSVGLLFSMFYGQVILAAATLLIYLGILWAWRILSVDM